MATASARPGRLKNFGTTTDAIRDGLRTRAGFLEDQWDGYRAQNGADWRFDFSDLPGAIRAFANTLAEIGAFTGDVGQAFEDADQGGDGVADASDSRIRRLLDDRWDEVMRRADLCIGVDWGSLDDPPDWLEALRTTSLVFGVASDGGAALRVGFVQAYRQYVRVGGPVRDAFRYRPGTGGRALLGGFASASDLVRYERLFGGAADAFGGFAAGVQQWTSDSASLNYTSEEQLHRALIRGGGTAGFGVAGGMLGSLAASAACGPGAPICAGVVIVGTGLVASGVGDRIIDIVVDNPDPAEHDPDIVESRVATGVDVDNMLGISGDAGSVGVQAADAANEQRLRTLQVLALDPELAESMELPSHLPTEFDPMSGSATDWVRTSPPAPPPAGPGEPLTPEELAAIDEYVDSLGGP